MSSAGSARRRVRFYGAADLAAYWQAACAADIAEGLDPAVVPTGTADIIELHNVQLYLEAGLLPPGYTDEQRAQAQAKIPAMRRLIATHFTKIDDTNVGELVADVDHEYHTDLLELLGRNKAFARCDAQAMLSALSSTGVDLGALLANKRLVQAYDAPLREALMSDVRNAEHLVRKHMREDAGSELCLPRSLTSADRRELLQGYVDSAGPNLNYVGLIERAPVDSRSGVDAKLKLSAKRRSQRLVEELFRDNPGVKTGCAAIISDTQDDPLIVKLDGMVATFTYGRGWLDETLDNPSILNNFQHLFEFADRDVLLTLPAFPADLGVFERFLTTRGKTEYAVGAAFRAVDMSSLLQTRLYRDYLASKGIDLEAVIAWFFEEYLVEQFGALNFSFKPSGAGSSYLEKARHLFAEMESVAMQFALYVENGELDRELLAVTSDLVRYKQLPSMLIGKYVYAKNEDEIAGVLHALFSDQSGLTYISETLKGSGAAQLLLANEVAYADFADHQRPAVDHLITLGVLENTGLRLQIANREQFLILSSLFKTQAASYYHLSHQARVEVESMVARGWVSRRTTLLSDAESSYFNYYLNKAEFTNGPELRNKYLHGTQANADGENAHVDTYITALKLIVALVIKLNDEFCLKVAEGDALDQR